MILSVAGVEFSYNGHPVLRDVSFQAEAGQMVAVLGVNGAGKSTLLKCINRILKPKRGTISLDGQNIRWMDRTETARYLGYVPQNRGVEEVSVFDAVLLGRKPHMKWSAGERDLRAVERTIRDMDLEGLAMRPLSTLSGGEVQKVLIARALAQEPAVLVLDEPTNSLDVKNQMEIMDLLKRIVREKNLLALVSIHDLNMALRFADRFLMLKEGAVYAAIEGADVTPALIREVYGVDVILGEVEGCRVAVPLNR